MKWSFEKPKKPDPSKTSILQESLNLKKVFGKKGILRDSFSKDNFHRLSPESKGSFDPEKEQFISLFLKGIINTADVVRDPKSGDFFSHEQAIEDVPVEVNGFKEEIGAELTILSVVFGDNDRSYHPDHPSNTKDKFSKNNKWEQSHNLMVSSHKDKKYHFDFGGALNYFDYEFTPSDEKELVEFARRKILGFYQIIGINNKKIFLEKTLLKLEKIIAQCFSTREFFEAVVKRSGFTNSKFFKDRRSFSDNFSDEDKLDTLFRGLKTRADILKVVLEEELKISN